MQCVADAQTAPRRGCAARRQAGHAASDGECRLCSGDERLVVAGADAHSSVLDLEAAPSRCGGAVDMHFALVGGMRGRAAVGQGDLDAVDAVAALDGASGAAHHVAVHEPLPVFGEVASPERCEAVGAAVEAAGDLLDAVLGDGGVGRDTKGVLLSHEQGQLVGDVGEVEVVGRGRQQHDLGVVVLDEALDLLVVLALAVAQVVRLVDHDSAVAAPQL